MLVAEIFIRLVNTVSRSIAVIFLYPDMVDNPDLNKTRALQLCNSLSFYKRFILKVWERFGEDLRTICFLFSADFYMGLLDSHEL